MSKIAIVADFDPNFPPHPATQAALEHSAAALGVQPQIEWLPTESLATAAPQMRLQDYCGFFIGPGSPYRSMSGALAAIRFAREYGRPLISTCGGSQHLIIEFARHVLGISDAEHAEYDPYASTLFISALKCTLSGKTLLVDIIPGSLAWGAYQRRQALEKYYCNFGLNPVHRKELESAGLAITGIEAGEEQSRGDARIMELKTHPFYVGTLFVPQMQSTPHTPHPLISHFLRAALTESATSVSLKLPQSI